jgi:hypothetical protein
MSVSEAMDYQETISLLQEEIVRLENELRIREELAHDEPIRPEADDSEADEAVRRQLDELAAELAARDETIALLVEQSRLFEEASAADRASWEQLNQWVQDLERRVEDQGDRGGEAAAQALEAERRRSEADRREAETLKRAWESQRQSLEAETERLRNALAQAVQAAADPSEAAALATLEQENRRLRAANAEIARVAATAAEADVLRDRLQQSSDEVESLTRELRRADDDRERQLKERDVLISELRSQLAHESLRRQDEQVKAAVASTTIDGSSPLAADERIRALRQHLQQIHEQEEQERARKRLSARLSRLWNRTGPAR